MLYGCEKAYAESDWKRRMGYRALGELHIPGRLRAWHVIRTLKDFGLWSQPTVSLLDAGGGEGAFAYFVARRHPGWQIVVADNEQATLDRGRRIKDALGFQHLEVKDIDLRDVEETERFDVVVCSDVLEHIEEDEIVVKQLARALKPGGILILTSPSVPQPRHLPIVAWRERRIGFDPSDYGHVRQGYSLEHIASLMRQAGLVPERVRYTFGFFGTLMFDLFFATGDSRPNPVVFAVLFPVYMGLAAMDLVAPTRHGAAVLAVGRKE